MNVMVPRTALPPPMVDVTAAMDERARSRAVRLPVLDTLDPYAEVEV